MVKDISVLYFGGNGPILYDNLDGCFMKHFLNLYKTTNFDFVNIKQPVIDYKHKGRTMDEDYSLSDKKFYSKFYKIIKNYLPNKKIYLLGYSLGACVILGFLMYLANKTMSTNFYKKFEIITLNSDIFFPNYKLEDWNVNKFNTNWLNTNKYPEISNLNTFIKTNNIKFHHIFNSYYGYNLPYKYKKYKYIKYYSLDNHFLLISPIEFLNHSYISNFNYSKLINQIISKVDNDFIKSTISDANKFKDTQIYNILEPSLTNKILKIH